uniref:Uncharacterized protein n=1 Tax=Candidatus Kentrum sp. FM TaxID=2126340 RepID=A0A450STT6_9GAMM|nr:MAG: hypothetical protein BECKFM1743A_GA0114220_101899 [Candidatus Kentron sp. FM]VFJ64834.1 MAG: hypothetical protein BECKFM1743C_GA0114222_103785 [Candidatus Kentron sp. FM]VFK15483.1 MAG: hypothetical protein BECKFM1743B_GA0114221_103731 [Candidatus Kentron sp. FM]
MSSFSLFSSSVLLSGHFLFFVNIFLRLLLDSGLMADLWDYPSEIDVDGRMFGGEHLGSPLRSPRT